MIRKIIFIFFFIIINLYSRAEDIYINFSFQKIKIKYDKSMLAKYTFKPNDEGLKKYYFAMEKTNYKILTEDLNRIKNELKLNDWFYYKLVSQTAQVLCENETENQKQLFCWFVLIKSDYNVIISYDKLYNLYALTEDNVFAANTIMFKNKKYVKLNAEAPSPKFYYSQFFPNKKDKEFSFSITLPELTTDSIVVINKTFKINNKEESFVYNVSLNYIKLMNDYPTLSTEKYFDVPLSLASRNSLIPQLREKIKGLNSEEAVRYILSYVRLSFKHKDDKLVFGHSRSMIAEEALYYEYGDCEDKSALFYYLVKELIGAPMLILDYPKHINIAVKLDKAYGKPIKYNSIEYSVCEPNESGDTRAIGDAPEYNRYPSPKVIGGFKVKGFDK